MFFLIWKMAKISLFKGPPLWFGARNPDFLISGAKPKGGAFEKWNFSNFWNKEKHEKSGNFRNRDFATIPQSHNPTIPEFFSPGAPAENLGGGRLIRNDRPSWVVRSFFGPLLVWKRAPAQRSFLLMLDRRIVFNFPNLHSFTTSEIHLSDFKILQERLASSIVPGFLVAPATSYENFVET